MVLKCIKEKCNSYFSSDDRYVEICQLANEYIPSNKCIGLGKIPDRKEELSCKIAKLVGELEYLNGLEELIKGNQ